MMGKRVLSVVLTLLMAAALAACTTVSRTTYKVVSQQSKEVAFYATILALQERKYALERADLKSGYILTKRRAHESGSFWWQLVCTVDDNGVVTIDIKSNLVSDTSMHRRARHWIHQIKKGTERVLETYSPQSIVQQGKAALAAMLAG